MTLAHASIGWIGWLVRRRPPLDRHYFPRSAKTRTRLVYPVTDAATLIQRCATQQTVTKWLKE